MSWDATEVYEWEIEVVIDEDKLFIEFTCPRCGTRQRQTIIPKAFSYDIDIACQNSAVCGSGNAYLTIPLTGYGKRKGELDVPLRVESDNCPRCGSARCKLEKEARQYIEATHSTVPVNVYRCLDCHETYFKWEGGEKT